MLPLAALLVGAAALEIEGRGESPVIGGNTASARSRAIKAAQRDCVARAVAGQLGVEPAALEAMHLGPVLIRAEHFLRSYRVLEEGEQGGPFTVRLSCEVDQPRLQHAAEGIVGAGSSSGDGAVAGLRLRVRPARYESRARALVVRSGLPLASAATDSRLSPRTMTLDIEVRLQDEPVLRGLGWPARRASTRINLRPGGISVNAQAFGTAPSAERAADLAAERALDHALSDLVPLLRSAASTARFELHARGLHRVVELRELQGALEEVAGGATLRSLDGRAAVFLVGVAGGAPALATRLRGRRWGTLVLSRLQFSGGALWLTFAPPG